MYRYCTTICTYLHLHLFNISNFNRDTPFTCVPLRSAHAAHRPYLPAIASTHTACTSPTYSPYLLLLVTPTPPPHAHLITSHPSPRFHFYQNYYLSSRPIPVPSPSIEPTSCPSLHVVVHAPLLRTVCVTILIILPSCPRHLHHVVLVA